MQLPGNSRQMLRNEVRRNPGLPAALSRLGIAPVTKINDLSKDQLLRVAEELAIDVVAIVAREVSITTPTVAAMTTNAVDVDNVLHPAEGQDTPTAQPFFAFSRDGADAAEDVAEDVNTQKAIEAEAQELRRELSRSMLEGDFNGVTARITSLLTDARKPPVVETRVEYVAAPAGTDPATLRTAPVAVPSPVGTSTWGKLFGITGAMGGRKINIFAPSPLTPQVDPRYRWPASVTAAALCAMGRGRNVWMYGPAGTGKTSFAEQLAAKTGRPHSLISCDDTTEAPELVGMTVPHNGGVRWQDGVLTAAIRIPHNVILIDEPTVARAGAVMVLQSILASGVLSIKETGEVVRVAEGCRFIVADNTNGTGGGTSEGYEGTRRMNRATLDRFATFLRVDYMSPTDEAAALVAHTNCTPQLAKLLVECAGLTRKARVTHALGLRRLIAWAEALTDGLDPRTAFEVAILNSCARDDKEPTEHCCALGLDQKQVKDALAGHAPAAPVAEQPLPAGAADFA